MAYLVLARKYRPQRFGEMSGQEHVVRTLANALKRGPAGPRLPLHRAARRRQDHRGPPGGQGASTARRGRRRSPAASASPAAEIAEGRAVDVIEIDAASNNGVDNVRDIVEAVKYRPARDRFKVFVIDEVHMLSQGAFNALLKTLEEPPAHVDVRAGHHRRPQGAGDHPLALPALRLPPPHPAADRRPARPRRRRGGDDALARRALAMVARAAEGGMRDALSLLDRVRAACGDAPGDAEVAEALGTVDVAAVSRLAGALLRRDGAALLAEIAALHERGLEMKRVAEELAATCATWWWRGWRPTAPLDLPDAELGEVRRAGPGRRAGPARPASSTSPSAPWSRPSWPTSRATPWRWRCSRRSSSPRAPTSRR